MKRGTRILLILLILILVLSVAAAFLLRSGGGLLSIGGAQQTDMVDIIVMAAPVGMDEQITEASLTTMPYAKDHVNPSMISNKAQAVGKYARFQLGAGLPLTVDMIADRPGMSQEGSQAAKTIPPGMVAVTIQVNQLNSVAYGLKDGDKVNIIITTNFYDADSDYQSKLPNYTAAVNPSGPASMSAYTATGGWPSRQGRSELDNTLGQAMYVVPMEQQRPRTVSQTLLQDIQILHVGDFVTGGAAQTAPVEGQPTPTPAPSFLPNVITLLVSPQEAVVLTYLMNINAKFNFVLRAPDDTSKIDTDAATLQFLLSQYEIPVPSRMPYIIDNSDYSPAPVAP